MKKLLLCLCLLCLLPARSSADGRWTLHQSFHNATACYPVADLVYAICNGGLMSYSPTDTEIRFFTKAEGMSDTDITQSAWSEKSKCLILLYGNYNIDLFFADGRIVNLPQYKNNSNVSDKQVNDLSVYGSMAYLSTASGILELNTERCEFGNLYATPAEARTCARIDNELIADCGGKLYKGSLNNNLLNPGEWKELGSGGFVGMRPLGNFIYARGGDGIYRIRPEGGFTRVVDENVSAIHMDEGSSLTAWNKQHVYQISPDGNITRYDAGTNDLTWVAPHGETTFWTCRGYQGLQRQQATSGTLQASEEAIIPDSPIRNYCYYLSHTPQGRLLVAGGSLNYTGQIYPGTLMTYENGTWTNLPEEGISQTTGLVYQNLTSLAQDPADDTHFFASSARQGLYEFQKGQFTAHYDCENSPLSYIQAGGYVNRRNYVSTDGLTYDSEGNLWMINNQVDTIIRCRLKDGSWRAYYFAPLSGLPTCEKLLFDRQGYLWLTSKRSTTEGNHHSGVFAYDRESGRSRFRSSFTNQDGTGYTPDNVYAVTEDLDGRMWVGTNLGPFVIDDAEQFLDDPSYPYTQVKIPRNDGTNLADYLLSGTAITAIAVDGGNRKWMGTGSNGVYVLSPDGTETVDHFTTANAPLPSDNIQSLSINPVTGEVFIGTDKGLVSYRSDVRPAADKLKESNLIIYPNPVRPGYQGNIVISGLTYNCDVTITTAGGQAVAGGTSTGGTFTWNGRDTRGNRVGTGVYFIMAATSDGEKGVVGRIIVVK